MLHKGRHVVVIGGPRMGKSHLVNEVEQLVATTLSFDNVQSTMIPELVRQPRPALITTDISFLESSRLLGESVFRVPLTTIVPKQLKRWPGAEWSTSRGHPNLAAARSETIRQHEYSSLLNRWNHLLASNAPAQELCSQLLAMPSSMSPVERYQTVRARYGLKTKRILDWLVCLGMVHRQKYHGGAAGIVPVFTSPLAI